MTVTGSADGNSADAALTASAGWQAEAAAADQQERLHFRQVKLTSMQSPATAPSTEIGCVKAVLMLYCSFALMAGCKVMSCLITLHCVLFDLQAAA